MEQFKRMCWYYSRDKSQKSCPMCTSYPNCNIGQCRKIAFEKPEHFATTVMCWAAEHPEPVYPTWGEYLVSIKALYEKWDDHVNEFDNATYALQSMRRRIPSDIANKLGIEPVDSRPEQTP